MRRILVVPDSMWGNDSGHRSSQFLAKTLKKQGFEVGVYAEDNPSFAFQKEMYLEKEGVSYFAKNPYSFLDQFFLYKKKNLFKNII